MNWRALASSIFDYLDQVPSPKWLGVAATCVSLVLLIGLIVLSDRYLRLRRRVAEQGEADPAETATVGWEDELAPIYDRADADSAVAAKLQAGVVTQVKKCTTNWCHVAGNGFDGWIQQERLWGVYSDEQVN